MATQFHLPVTAAQVGTYFVGKYYQVLQHQPEFVHHFYTDASTVVRVDRTNRETASAMLQIHNLIMSLNYTGIEIKTANSLESWNGGVLIMVSGSVLLKDFNGWRKFVETFFLAPQETGYFVLSDIFHFIEDDQIYQHPVAYLAPGIHDSKFHSPTAVQESVSSYMPSGDLQARGFVGSSSVEESCPTSNYSFPEQQLRQLPETADIKEKFAVQPVQPNGSLQSTLNPAQEHQSSLIEDPAEEPHKHTYASILQVAKGQPGPLLPSHSSLKKASSPSSRWDHISEPSNQQSFTPSVTVTSFGREEVKQVSAVDAEVEIKSVYVRNVPSTVSASEIEEEFKKFGKLKTDGVAIRTRKPKEMGVCYAFVEFEDLDGVQNAIKASTVELGGQQAFIEERKAERINVFRAGPRKVFHNGGRGRGRGGYYMDSSKGRFGVRNFGGGTGQDGYNRHRSNGNGYYRPSQQQERVYSGNQQASSNGKNSSE